MKDRCLLVGDIGGTNARFALATPDRPGFHDALEFQCADFRTADDAISHYLKATNADSPQAVCLAVAGPIIDDSVKITNNHWDISAAETRADFGIENVRLLNDFTAIAYSVPLLTETEVRSVGRHDHDWLPKANFTVAILGPGTGLGVAGLCRRGDTLVPIVGEGGHVGFAPETELQLEILETLRSQFGRVSAERLLAGSGLENIYRALGKIRHESGPALSAAQIFAERRPGNLAAEAIDVFFEALGQIAGDVALMLGATDGVYIAGGIAKRYPELLENSRFRAAFEEKGRHRSLVERIPTRLITYDQPGLLGAAFSVLDFDD